MDRYQPSPDKALDIIAIEAEARRLRAETLAGFWRNAIAFLRRDQRPTVARSAH